jgi:AcrR family transcriptional regulator
MARPRRVSDEQICQAMRQAVLAHGPAVPLDVVAQELGVTGPALLKRFGTRENLMVSALLPPPEPDWVHFVRGGPSSAPLREQLLEVFTRISAFMKEVVPCLTALRESGIPHDRVFRDRSSPQRGLESLRGWLAEARKRGLVTAPEIDTSALAIMGALQARAFYQHVLQADVTPGSQQDYLNELADIFTRVLAPAPAPRAGRQR